MTSRMNDHHALTAERREEIENTAYMVAAAALSNPGLPYPNVDGEMLVDAVKHIGVLDTRIGNFTRIFMAVQKQQEHLEQALQMHGEMVDNAPEGLEIPPALVPLDQVVAMFQNMIQGALNPGPGSGARSSN